MVDDDGSDDATMTPPLPLDHVSQQMSQQMSQLSQLLPTSTRTTTAPAASAASAALYRPAEQSQGLLRGPKPKAVAGMGGRVGVKASAVVQTVDDIRKDSLRAMKKLPVGEAPTMWTLMTNLSQVELKTLCRYCGLSPGAKASKQDLGQLVLNAFQKGAFRSLFKVVPTTEAQERTTAAPSVSQPGASKQRQLPAAQLQPQGQRHPQTQTQTQTQTPPQLPSSHTHTHARPPSHVALGYATSVAVVQLGGDVNWRPADLGNVALVISTSDVIVYLPSYINHRLISRVVAAAGAA